MKTKQSSPQNASHRRGYILAVVLVFSFVFSTLVLTAFTVLYQYTEAAKLSLESTREEVKYEASTDAADQYGGGENAGN